MNTKRLERLAELKGYSDLVWYSPPKFFKETKNGFGFVNSRYVLYGKPENYKGIYSDYKETIIAEIKNSNWDETIGYCWTKKGGTTVGELVRE